MLLFVICTINADFHDFFTVDTGLYMDICIAHCTMICTALFERHLSFVTESFAKLKMATCITILAVVTTFMVSG